MQNADLLYLKDPKTTEGDIGRVLAPRRECLRRVLLTGLTGEIATVKPTWGRAFAIRGHLISMIMRARITASSSALPSLRMWGNDREADRESVVNS